MRRRTSFLVVSLLLAFGALARDTRKELSVNLKFMPQEGVKTNSPDLTPSVLERSIAINVEDGRGGDAAVIGQGTNDDDATFHVRASSDVIAYLTDTARQVAADWGLKSTDQPDRLLTLKVARFFVDESNKAVGSVYASEVKFTYTLADGAGKKLIEGAASGSAHRYGRARSADNCNEVLSDALKEALANVISDPRLQEAWASGKASGGAAAEGSSPESVEERLRKLDDLLKKKLITKEEYDRKRAEILKDL